MSHFQGVRCSLAFCRPERLPSSIFRAKARQAVTALNGGYIAVRAFWLENAASRDGKPADFSARPARRSRQARVFGSLRKHIRRGHPASYELGRRGPAVLFSKAIARPRSFSHCNFGSALGILSSASREIAALPEPRRSLAVDQMRAITAHFWSQHGTLLSGYYCGARPQGYPGRRGVARRPTIRIKRCHCASLVIPFQFLGARP